MRPQMQRLFGELRSALAAPKRVNQAVLQAIKTSKIAEGAYDESRAEEIALIERYLWGQGVRLDFNELAYLEPWEHPLLEGLIPLVTQVSYKALPYIPSGLGVRVQTLYTDHLEHLFEESGQAFDLPSLKRIAAAQGPDDPYKIAVILEEWGITEYVCNHEIQYFSIPQLVSLTAPLCPQIWKGHYTFDGKFLQHLTLTSPKSRVSDGCLALVHERLRTLESLSFKDDQGEVTDLSDLLTSPALLHHLTKFLRERGL